MSSSVILDNIREFEKTFEQRYGRKMNTEEVHVLQAARELILDQIAKANRVFFKGRERQRGAKERYEERKIRIVEIRTEFASLMNGKKCA
jgi:hypothetical protein